MISESLIKQLELQREVLEVLLHEKRSEYDVALSALERICNAKNTDVAIEIACDTLERLRVGK